MVFKGAACLLHCFGQPQWNLPAVGWRRWAPLHRLLPLDSVPSRSGSEGCHPQYRSSFDHCKLIQIQQWEKDFLGSMGLFKETGDKSPHWHPPLSQESSRLLHRTQKIAHWVQIQCSSLWLEHWCQSHTTAVHTYYQSHIISVHVLLIPWFFLLIALWS